MNYKYIFSGQQELPERVIAFFTAEVTNPSLFERIQTFRKTSEILKKRVNNLEFLISTRQLTNWDFMIFELDYAKRHGIPNATVDSIVQLMVDARILFKDSIFQFGQQSYSLNTPLTKILAERDCLHDTIFGFQFIASKYQGSIFKIAVEDQVGDHHIGTGFLFSVPGASSPDRTGLVLTHEHVILTNEHVIRDAKSIRVLRPTNDSVGYKRVVPSKTNDLAIIELANHELSPPFHLVGNPTVLDEVISIGYPNVAMARDSYQLTHRGEINSIIEDLNGRKLILFSAKTGPGNSGGPLINQNGFVLGMVCEDLFFKEALIEKGQLPYHAALPASTIQEFISKVYPPQKSTTKH